MRESEKILRIIRREYVERVTRKSFLIGTLLGPILIGGVLALPFLLDSAPSDAQRHLAVIDATGVMAPRLQAILDDTIGNGQRKYVLAPIQASGDGYDALVQPLAAVVEAGELDALLVIPSDVSSGKQIEYYSRSAGNLAEIKRLEGATNQIVIEERLHRQGLDPDEVKQLIAPLSFTTIALQQGRMERRSPGEDYARTTVFAIFLYLTILLYGVSIMRAVIEEKASRVVEVLLSSVTPFQLMMGKILGVGAVGLTQCAIWALFALGLSTYGVPFIAEGATITAVPASTLVFFVVFYILGYFLFATLYAGIGAVCSTDHDAQQFQLPVTLFLIVPLMVAPMVVQEPDSLFARILSLIPLFSPTLMFLRLNVLPPPPHEVILAIALMVAAIFLFIFLVARVFRVGVLMYGKRPTVPEIVRWMRYR